MFLDNKPHGFLIEKWPKRVKYTEWKNGKRFGKMTVIGEGYLRNYFNENGVESHYTKVDPTTAFYLDGKPKTALTQTGFEKIDEEELPGVDWYEKFKNQ